MKGDALDPKALIREAYRIEGISAAECRSIFMDWALSMPQASDSRTAIAALIERHAPDNVDHPMTVVLQEGLADGRPAQRRGGWRGRRRRPES
jgi:hypothetical protein